MNEMNNTPDQDVHPCEIRIDRDGIWYFRGAEMFRRDIVKLFYENLKKDESGRYLIDMGNEKCYLDVEDTPFVVTSVERSGSNVGKGENVILTLIDGTEERLDPSTLRIGKDNVLYCSIRNGEYEARFSRASYYDIAGAFEHDPETDRYFFSINGETFYIHGQPSLSIGNAGGESC
jgi:hypothetical protein